MLYIYSSAKAKNQKIEKDNNEDHFFHFTDQNHKKYFIDDSVSVYTNNTNNNVSLKSKSTSSSSINSDYSFFKYISFSHEGNINQKSFTSSIYPISRQKEDKTFMKILQQGLKDIILIYNCKNTEITKKVNMNKVNFSYNYYCTNGINQI